MDIFDRRFKFLTPKQQEIAKIAKDRGYITLGTIKAFYSSKEHWTRALDKLISFNVLIPNKGSGEDNILFKRFEYNPFPELENIQKTLEEVGIENNVTVLDYSSKKVKKKLSREEYDKVRKEALSIIEGKNNSPNGHREG